MCKVVVLLMKPIAFLPFLLPSPSSLLKLSSKSAAVSFISIRELEDYQRETRGSVNRLLFYVNQGNYFWNKYSELQHYKLYDVYLKYFTKNFLHRVLREIENIRHDASLLKEQMTLVKEDIRVVKMMISLLVIFLTFSYLTIINFIFLCDIN